jgi:hypothetical protein
MGKCVKLPIDKGCFAAPSLLIWPQMRTNGFVLPQQRVALEVRIFEAS